MKNESIDYIFVFDIDSKGWWLKIDSVEKLNDYYLRTLDSRFSDALSLYLRDGSTEDILNNLDVSDRLQKIMDPTFKRLQMIELQARKHNKSILDSIISINLESGISQLNDIREYGSIFINPVGGKTFGIEYDRFVRRKNLVFPNFNAADIRVKQFDNGDHYYAYIGDVQVKVSGVYKWNTFDEAMRVAESYITE